MTTIDFVPPKLELPATVLTVNVTECTEFLMPVLVTVHGDPAHVPDPLAPLLHVHDTVAAVGEPFCVTVIRTLAVQRDPVVTREPWSDTDTTGAVTVTFWELVPVAPSSSVAVSVTLYVPLDAYVCDTVAPVPDAPSPKTHESEAIVPSVSDPDPVKEHASAVQECVNDADGGWFGGGGLPTSTSLGLNRDWSCTSSSGSWMPSPESSVQSWLPAPTTVE